MIGVSESSQQRCSFKGDGYKPNTTDHATEEKEPAVDETDSRYSDMMQLLLDARMGIDREKLQEIKEIETKHGYCQIHSYNIY